MSFIRIFFAVLYGIFLTYVSMASKFLCTLRAILSVASDEKSDFAFDALSLCCVALAKGAADEIKKIRRNRTENI